MSEHHRYAVNVWISPTEIAEDETTHAVYNEARAQARTMWLRHQGKRRVTVFDDRNFVVLLSLEPGPITRRSLPCHDPEHRSIPHAIKSNKRRR